MPAETEVDASERGGGVHDRGPAGVGDRRERGPPVVGVGAALDQPVALEAVDGVGDAGRMDLEALADLAERQGAGPGEVQQRQRLEPRERQAERRQRLVDASAAGSGAPG